MLKSSIKDVNYLAESGAASPGQVDAVLNDVELIMGKIDNEELGALAAKLGKKSAAEEIKRLVGAGSLKEGEAKTLGS